ncbi:SpoIID/LytB domain-containing protein [Paenibacillus sp. CC-CFT747]|nr:SpoIID/LytB domain-containing protein [Paenibacillus sp. CC-CFT747]
MTELVLQENAGIPVYSLWLGGESEAGRLEAVKAQALAAAPGLTLAPLDAAAPYLMKRTDVSASTNGASGLTHYSFNSNGEKVLVSPRQSKIQVKEKNRAYRGTIELSPFNGKLAVINELPFEEYLYSVVTSEMNTGWPKEALKAQAVAARTYAAKAGLKYGIAHVSDSVADQAYNGNEYADVTQAVEATRGEMLADKTGALITPYYSSNAGGMSSESSEVWNAGVPYLKSVPSPDERASKDKPVWYKVVRKDGAVGYVHPSYLKDTGTKNPAGLPVYQATEVVNVRSIPTTNQNNSVVLGQLAAAERVTIIGSTPESTEYAWIRGPYKADVLLPKINAGLTSPLLGLLTRLETGARGLPTG